MNVFIVWTKAVRNRPAAQVLDLPLSKHIVAQHEAQISLESEEGAGTEIKVTFLK